MFFSFFYWIETGSANDWKATVQDKKEDKDKKKMSDDRSLLKMPVKGATKLYFTHYLRVVIIFSIWVYQVCIFYLLFWEASFSSFCVLCVLCLSSVLNFMSYLKNYKIYIIIVYVSAIWSSVSLFSLSKKYLYL